MKVGDKVMYVGYKGTGIADFTIGKTYTICEIDDNLIQVINDFNIHWWWYSNTFTLTSEHNVLYKRISRRKHE